MPILVAILSILQFYSYCFSPVVIERTHYNIMFEFDTPSKEGICIGANCFHVVIHLSGFCLGFAIAIGWRERTRTLNQTGIEFGMMPSTIPHSIKKSDTNRPGKAVS